MPKHLIAIEKVATLPDVSGYLHGYPVHNEADGIIYTANVEAATPGWDAGGAAAGGGESPNAVTIAASGATPTLDLANGRAFDVTLDQNATFAFTGAEAGKESSFRLVLRQDATGGRTATFPTNVHWAGGTAPTLTTTAEAVDLLEFFTLDGGTTWFGRVLELNVSAASGGAIIADVSGATYASVTQATGGWDAQISKEIWFSPDGTMLFFNGSQSVERVDLATAWDITSGSLNANVLNVSAHNTNTRGLWLSEDGTRVFVSCQTDPEILQYTLSTPFDLSTATFNGLFLSTGAPVGCWVKDDGTRLYVIDETNDLIRQYTLSTPWDVTTAGSMVTFDITTVYGFPKPKGLFVSSDGSAFFITDDDADVVRRLDLSTPWDVTTAAQAHTSPSLSAQGNMNGIFIKPDATKMWLHESGNNIDEYNL